MHVRVQAQAEHAAGVHAKPAKEGMPVCKQAIVAAPPHTCHVEICKGCRASARRRPHSARARDCCPDTRTHTRGVRRKQGNEAPNICRYRWRRSYLLSCRRWPGSRAPCVLTYYYYYLFPLGERRCLVSAAPVLRLQYPKSSKHTHAVPTYSM